MEDGAHDPKDEDADAHHAHADDAARFVFACACFCRGALSLDRATPDDVAIAHAREQGLRLHRFKRAHPLPRVQRVLSALRALAPASLLDVGTGRGALLWPLLEAVPDVPVTCVDVRDDRVRDLEACARGGLQRLSAHTASVEALPLADDAVDVAIASEVLEHVHDERAAARELVRVARRFVLVTVPSVPDDNPEHVRLFTAATLRALFLEAGAVRVQVDGVRGHLFAVVTCRADGGHHARA